MKPKKKGKGKVKVSVSAKIKKVPTKKITAASIIVNLLSQKIVPADDVIINAVLAKVETSKFNKAQLAWYKNKFKAGKFHGNKPQNINQPSARNLTAAKTKIAKKKLKIKKLTV